MKLVTVFIALFLSFCISGYGQRSMTIINNTACPYSVFLWAEAAATMLTRSCTEIQTHLVVPCCSTMVFYANPYDFDATSGGPGWDFLPGGGSTVKGRPCFGPWVSPACLLPDWNWTQAMVDFTGGCTPACPVVGTIGGCPGVPLMITCGGSGAAIWTNIGGDITIEIR